MSDETTTLRYDNSEPRDISRVASLVFGELVKLAIPIVTAYHSDLYEDAVWIRTNLEGTEQVFYYGVDDAGTAISRIVEHTGHRKHQYRVTVAVDKRGRYTLRIQGA